ncbi:MAG: hypothetical protein HY097_02420 [Nitrospinae bacterium]|nr:hypothetical protein [Nitrospinota bacterium]MBI3813240.1 hypothetical protein [Nitrospinota bacterium]
MIKKFIEDFEKTIDSNPIILSSNIQKHFGPDGNTAYLKGSIVFIDSSCLELAIFIKAHGTVSIDKYRYHYMDKQRQMFFRYDNASHHPEVPSHPHHKHIENNVISAHLPTLKGILDEISAAILKK